MTLLEPIILTQIQNTARANFMIPVSDFLCWEGRYKGELWLH